MFPILLTGWLISLVPYICGISAILHADHYRDIGAHSVFEITQVIRTCLFLARFLFIDTMTRTLPTRMLSVALFSLVVYGLARYRREINWKTLLFFLLFGAVNTFIMLVFRMQWGMKHLYFPRYFVFSAFMLAVIYALVLDLLIKKIGTEGHETKLPAVFLLCFFFVGLGGVQRYGIAKKTVEETMAMQTFIQEFSRAFDGYFQEKRIDHLEVRDGNVSMPCLIYKNPYGMIKTDIGRYPERTRKFYAEYILPYEISRKIIWGKETDPDLKKYLEENNYSFLKGKQ